MKTEKPFSFQQVDRPPPGAGRTCSPQPPNTRNIWFYCKSCRTLHPTRRQVTAERDANERSPDGEYAGNKFPWRSSHRATLAILGLGFLIVSVLVTIMAARTAHHFEGWRCHPGDRATTNGRDLCPDRGARR